MRSRHRGSVEELKVWAGVGVCMMYEYTVGRGMGDVYV